MMDDSAQAPLIANRGDLAGQLDDDNVDLDNVDLLLEKSLQHPGFYVWLLTFAAGISGLLFGYDTGVISATLVSIGSDLSRRALTTLDKSLITSSTCLFALLVSPIAGVLADRLGRRRIILLADGLFMVGATMQAATNTVWGMIAGRSIVGLAVGAASFVVPLYIGELSPSPFRGRLVTLSTLFVTLGQVVSYLVGYWLSETPSGWRWMVGCGAFPAVFQFFVLIWMPETPRWLVKVDRKEEARSTLASVFGGGAGMQKIVDKVLKGIETEVREEEEAKRGRMRGRSSESDSSWFGSRDAWSELYNVPGNRRALTISCLLQGLQQLCGFNSLMYFSATIFSMVGFDSPTLTSLSVAISNFLFTLVAVVLIDVVGRRRILLYTIPVMTLGLLLAAVGFFFVSAPSDTNIIPNHSGGDAGILQSERLASFLILGALILYVASYATGMGNVPWQQSELFPLHVRSLGSGLAASTNWASNFIVGLTFLPMMELLTPKWTFTTYALICMAGWVAILRIYPETNGLRLEQVGALLADGWGV